MRYITLKPFTEKYALLSEHLKKKVDKQVRHLLRSLRHPSLHAKKYDEVENIWQARIDGQYRLYFKIEDDIYVLIKIKKHAD